MDAEKPQIALKPNEDTMNLSFLLCPSGMHIANFLRFLYITPKMISFKIALYVFSVLGLCILKGSCLLLDWRTLEEHFKSLCSVLPHNYHKMLQSIPELLKDGGEQLSKLISSSPAKINEKIITYLIVKLCYSDRDGSLVSCNVMDKSVDLTGEGSTNVSSWSKVAIDCLPERSLVVKSSSTECRQRSILLQQSSSVTIVSDTHTTSNSSLLSTLECVTTSNSVVTSSIGGQLISSITTAAGM